MQVLGRDETVRGESAERLHELRPRVRTLVLDQLGRDAGVVLRVAGRRDLLLDLRRCQEKVPAVAGGRDYQGE